MTKQTKTRLVRLGDAKRLTKGEVGIGAELGSNRFEQQG
ncbi:hypothetical protein E1H18_799 [Caulobacter sp. RHG1]|jgi:hypothetical protein|nr:hypothetical protein [Caulobacter sp. RHG1]